MAKKSWAKGNNFCNNIGIYIFKTKSYFTLLIYVNPWYKWKSDKLTVVHYKREPKVSTFPAGDNKAQINRRA